MTRSTMSVKLFVHSIGDEIPRVVLDEKAYQNGNTERFRRVGTSSRVSKKKQIVILKESRLFSERDD
jgi:hypothetical protein